MSNFLLPVLFAAPMMASAQEIAPMPLRAATTVYPLMRGEVGSVRELRDGRLLLSAGALLQVKRGAITFDTIPDVPGGMLHALPGDSTLVYSGSWVLLDGLKPLGMLPGTNPVVTAARPLAGVDALGFALGQRGRWPDSSEVVLVARTTGEITPITKVLQGEPARGGIPAPIFVVNESASLSADGWIGVVRTRPYRVDWRSPDGRWILGPPVSEAPLPMDGIEQKAYLTRFFPRGVPSSVSIVNWPKVVEPFGMNSRPIMTPDSMLLVLRTPTAARIDPRYDVFNRDGVRLRQLQLGPRERIVGFGANAVYVFQPTEMDARNGQLRKYPWP